jgi:hypothetical protein
VLLPELWRGLFPQALDELQTQIANKVGSGVAKKESTCIAKSGNPC